MRTSRGVVGAAYSQIELHPGGDGWVHGPVDLGLASDEFGPVALTVPREYGQVPVEVQVTDAPPTPATRWDTAVEWSVRTGDAVVVSGWAGDGSVEVPAPPDVEMRVRYVVLDGQAARDALHAGRQLPGTDRYLLQLWPAPPAAPSVLRATAPWSQYWAFGADAARVVEAFVGVPDPERLDRVVDEALRGHPDVLDALRAGDERYREGIIRYAQELFRVTYTQGTYADLRHDASELARVIDARVARALG